MRPDSSPRIRVRPNLFEIIDVDAFTPSRMPVHLQCQYGETTVSLFFF